MSTNTTLVLLVSSLVAIGCKAKTEESKTAPSPPAAKPTDSTSKPTAPTAPAVVARTQANATGLWDVNAIFNVGPTREEVISTLKMKTAPNYMNVKRGKGRSQFDFERDGVTATFVFPADPKANLLWIETRSDGVCIEGFCSGSPLTSTAKFGRVVRSGDNLRCVGSADGQGFHATWTCPIYDTDFMRIWVTVPDAQNFLPGNAEPVDAARLIDAKATVIGFIWLARGATWHAEGYDEGDR